MLDRQGDKRFGYSTTFKLLDDEAVAYIRGLTENQEFVSKESQNYQNSKSTRNKKTSRDKYFETFQTKYVTSFSPFVLRNCAMHDPFLNDIYNSKEAEKYFSDIVGEDLR